MIKQVDDKRYSTVNEQRNAYASSLREENISDIAITNVKKISNDQVEIQAYVTASGLESKNYSFTLKNEKEGWKILILPGEQKQK